MSADQDISTVYSFVDVQASIQGPQGNFSLSDGGVSGEGIKITMIGDKNTLTIGAGGGGMHSLHASNAGRVTVSFLKTSPANALLSKMYNFQKQSSAFWGRNFIFLSNPVTGDAAQCLRGSFVKRPDNNYEIEGGVNNWEFDFQRVDQTLGNGLQPTGL